eukprot:TRINITY_DN63359_c0_g1_i1.p1 TRINITY_DN63359_c0_g1~~TRINITY_DN63359_c0_g1_i1.p1  ORF type:complete len:413 (+),score=97.64 TRINITY_DN63359_c0_g1_i1:83-1240(+)
MLGLDYASDEEDEAPPAPASGDGSAAPAKAEAAVDGKSSSPVAPGALEKPQAKAAGKAAAQPKVDAKAAAKVNDRKVLELRKAVQKSKSATAVVQIVRRSFGDSYDLRWGADALMQIAKRSTARTRKEWARDPAVQKLAEKVKAEATSPEAAKAGRADTSALLLVGLEALSRLDQHAKKDALPALERIITGMQADRWQHPVKSLAKLLWLAGDSELEGLSALPTELRERADTMDGPDVALVVQVLRKKTTRDGALNGKLLSRLRAEGVYEGMSATDLVELSEGLKDLSTEDETVLRPLGQEVLRRRGELTPDESHRVHSAFQSMRLPLPSVWTNPGAVKKRDGSQIVTTTTFVPQEGHEKKRRGNHDVERPSPPRVVRDYKMMSY